MDDAQFLKNVTEPELPKLIEAIYKIPAPKEPRNDLVDVFLKGVEGLNQPPHVTPSEQLRLNTSIEPTKKPKRLGVLDGDNQGFPNGQPAHRRRDRHRAAGRRGRTRRRTQRPG